MSYLLEPWQQHAARNGDAIILRAFPNGWDSDGWIVATFRNCQPIDAGLGTFRTHDAARRAAHDILGVT